jgi:hypothetical protein
MALKNGTLWVIPPKLQKSVRDALPKGTTVVKSTVAHPASPMWPTCRPSIALMVVQYVPPKVRKVRRIRKRK